MSSANAAPEEEMVAMVAANNAAFFATVAENSRFGAQLFPCAVRRRAPGDEQRAAVDAELRAGVAPPEDARRARPGAGAPAAAPGESEHTRDETRGDAC